MNTNRVLTNEILFWKVKWGKFSRRKHRYYDKTYNSKNSSFIQYKNSYMKLQIPIIIIKVPFQITLNFELISRLLNIWYSFCVQINVIYFPFSLYQRLCACMCVRACVRACVCCRVLALLFSFVVFLFFRQMYICHIHLCLLMAKSMFSADFANKHWTFELFCKYIVIRFKSSIKRLVIV